MRLRHCAALARSSNLRFSFLLLHSQLDDTGQPDQEIKLNSLPNIKPGIRLPKTDLDWKLANDFFVGALPIADINKKPINAVVSEMNSIIYDYFYRNCGPIENSHSSHFVRKYKDYSKAVLKSSLKALKSSKCDPNETRYVARTLHLQLRRDTSSPNSNIDHDK